MIDKALSIFERLCPGSVRRDVSFKTWTTFKCQGTAKAIVSPPDLEALGIMLEEVSARKLEWKVIGRGSNLLVRDGGYPGILFDLSKGFSSIQVQGESQDRVFIRAEGGVANGTLLQWLREKRLRGFGFAFGIPGSIGGGIRMNAGTPLGWFSHIVKEVEAVRATGELVRLRVSEEDFVYRDFPKGRDVVITAGLFVFHPASADRIETEINEAKAQRVNQPLELPNIGSVFKNPPNDYAGRLIEAAGLKGFKIGDAEISPKHANFIVNMGSATTKDALALMKHAQETVKSKFDVTLEPEVHVIGVDR